MVKKYNTQDDNPFDPVGDRVSGYQIVATGGDGVAWQPPGYGARRVFPHDLTHSPVALYQFDGTLTDSSGNSQPAMAVGGTGAAEYTEIAPGLLGYRLHADQNWLETAADAAFKLDGEFTFECLAVVYSDRQTGEVILFQLASTTPTYYASVTYPSASNEGFGFFHSPDGAVITLEEMPLEGQLHHVAIRRSGTKTISFFINGRQLGADFDMVNNPSSADTTAKFRIGANIVAAAKIDACVSSVKLIDFALTDAEIMAEAQRTLFGAERQIPRGITHLSDAGNAAANYKLNGDWTDSTGNFSALTPAGGTYFAPIAPGLTGVLLRSGKGTLATVDGTSLELLGDMTIHAIISYRSQGTTYQIIASVGDSSHITWNLYCGPNGELGFYETATGGGYLSGVFVPEHETIMISVRRRPSTYNLQFYLNGLPVGAETGTRSAPSSNTTVDFVIGNDAFSNWFGGTIAGVKIYSAMQTDSEILEEARRAGFVEPGPPLGVFGDTEFPTSFPHQIGLAVRQTWIPTSGGAYTVTLPNSTQAGLGAEILIGDLDGQSSINNITINPLGSDTFGAGITSLTLNIALAAYRCIAVDGGWRAFMIKQGG